ncbi:MAG: hypothetical protein NT150_00820 [Bacteroidetes bacterium]|nr:hypothetical protein [Bacteroidota bacterium]
MKSTVFSLITILMMSTSAFAQKKEAAKSNLTHSFGFNAGTTTGIGLSYQMYHKNKIGFQVTASPFVYSVDDQKLNFAATGLYKMRDKEYVDFVSYLSLNYIYSRNPSYEFVPYNVNDPYGGGYYSTIINTNQVNIGTGFGFEFDTKRDFKFSIMGGFAGYSTNNIWRVLPCIESSLFYTL